MDDLDSAAAFPAGPPPLFDADTFPAAPAVRQEFWGFVLRRLEQAVAPKGWDQPAQLWAIGSPAATEAATGVTVDTLRAQLGGDLGDDGPGLMYGMALLTKIHGHAPSEMWGYTAPDNVAALVLVTEAWAGHVRGPDGHIDQNHPTSREIRVLTAISRAGTFAQLQCDRDGDSTLTVLPPPGVPGFDPERDAGGTVVDVLRHALGVPLAAGDVPAAGLLGRRLFFATCAALIGVTDELLARQGNDGKTVREVATADEQVHIAALLLGSQAASTLEQVREMFAEDLGVHVDALTGVSVRQLVDAEVVQAELPNTWVTTADVTDALLSTVVEVLPGPVDLLAAPLPKIFFGGLELPEPTGEDLQMAEHAGRRMVELITGWGLGA